MAPPTMEADYLARVDPELREAYPHLIADIQDLFLRDVEAAKAVHRDAQARITSSFAGAREEAAAPGLDGDPDVGVTTFSLDPAFADCAIIWLHGGGYWAGSADHPSAHAFAHIAPVYSAHYRLAPDHTAPAQARDVCAVLDWLQRRKRPRAIVIAGESAGGGLAASAAILNRDRDGKAFAQQMLLYPTLDDQLDSPSARQTLPVRYGSRAALHKAWSLYLGGQPANAYAAAARANDLSGLPPAHIAVGELDLLRDECVNYAARLRAAGVATDLHLYPGAPHGFDHIAPRAQVSLLARAACEAALRKTFAQAA